MWDDLLRLAFNAGYRMGYGNGHLDAAEGESAFGTEPGEAFDIWTQEDGGDIHIAAVRRGLLLAYLRGKTDKRWVLAEAGNGWVAFECDGKRIAYSCVFNGGDPWWIRREGNGPTPIPLSLLDPSHSGRLVLPVTIS